MKVVRLPFFPKRYAMSFLGVILCGRKDWIDKYVQNHETIHLRQQQEMLFLPFYIIYVLELLYRSVQYRSFYKGYMNISHEREAYQHDHDLDYLKTRKCFAQFRISKGSR